MLSAIAPAMTPCSSCRHVDAYAMVGHKLPSSDEIVHALCMTCLAETWSQLRGGLSMDRARGHHTYACLRCKELVGIDPTDTLAITASKVEAHQASVLTKLRSGFVYGSKDLTAALPEATGDPLLSLILLTTEHAAVYLPEGVVDTIWERAIEEKSPLAIAMLRTRARAGISPDALNRGLRRALEEKNIPLATLLWNVTDSFSGQIGSDRSGIFQSLLRDHPGLAAALWRSSTHYNRDEFTGKVWMSLSPTMQYNIWQAFIEAIRTNAPFKEPLEAFVKQFYSSSSCDPRYATAELIAKTLTVAVTHGDLPLVRRLLSPYEFRAVKDLPIPHLFRLEIGDALVEAIKLGDAPVVDELLASSHEIDPVKLASAIEFCAERRSPLLDNLLASSRPVPACTIAKVVAITKGGS